MARFTIKQILISNENWWQFYNKYHDKIRESVVLAIAKLLSCKNTIRGYQQYTCSNEDCTHTKRIPHTCKSKACSSCGKKATELWIEKQNQLLPNTAWQHITFTMPAELWDFFWHNRQLLNSIGKIAADCIRTIANNKQVTPGVFIAIHTFGRDLKRNVHVHLSTTTGGLCEETGRWKKLYFNQSTLMVLWRYQITTLFRDTHKKQIIIPNNIQQQLNHIFTFNRFLDQLFKKIWIVHCSKPSKNHKKNVAYLGRYIKRPPIAESKLKHYDGYQVTFNFLDHRSQSYRPFKLSAEQFIARFIQHIPDSNFRMIRYYGFLAHRVRGKLLPIVYALFDQEISQNNPSPSYADLIKRNFHFDPLACILCGQQLVLSLVNFGRCSSFSLLSFHRNLALLKKC